MNLIYDAIAFIIYLFYKGMDNIINWMNWITRKSLFYIVHCKKSRVLLHKRKKLIFIDFTRAHNYNKNNICILTQRHLMIVNKIRSKTIIKAEYH